MFTEYDRKYWGFRADKYEKVEWVKSKKLIDVIVDYLPVGCGRTLCLGIGTGIIAEFITGKVKSIYGVDISMEMMNKAPQNVIKIQGDIDCIPFKPESFDCVLMRNVLHYIKNKENSTKEINSIIKMGGYFILSQVIPFTDEISSEYDWLVGRDIHYLTLNEIKSLYKIFKIEEVKEVVLPSQSILNWLNNTTRSEEERNEILNRHRNSSERYKKLVNYHENGEDIFVDMKHICVKMKKI